MTKIEIKNPDRKAMYETVVRNSDGGLKLVHHATGSSFDVSDMAPLTHFGTRRAANFRMLEQGVEDPLMVSAHIDVRNPLHIPDMNGDHQPVDIAELIEEAFPELFEGLMQEILEHDQGIQIEYIVEALKDAGYDGLSYTNEHEDPGSISWIILDASQVQVRGSVPAPESRDPWELTEEEYTGPSMILDVFEIDGEAEEYEHLIEALEYEGHELPVLARSPDGWEARWVDDWEPQATQGLYDPEGRVRGFYMGGQLWIDEEGRGAGRSSMMINAAADLLGGCPSQNIKGMGYSPSGHAAHVAAHRAVLRWAPVEAYRIEDNDPSP